MPNTATWRDITGLTDQQTAQLSADTIQTEETKFDVARTMAQRNRLQTTLTHITAPAGARHLGAWYDQSSYDDSPSRITRTIGGLEAVLDTVTARIVGEQDSAGTTTAWIEVIENPGTEGQLDARQARELAQALTEAADELERLTGDAPPFQ